MNTSKPVPSTLIVQLVGMHFRPPAKQVVATLPGGLLLILEPEPDNPFDPKAIKVLVNLAETLPLTHMEALSHSLEGTGYEIADVMREPLHLGYVADSDGKVCKASGRKGNREVAQAIVSADGRYTATLSFDPTSAPMVTVTTGSQTLTQGTVQ